MFVLIVVMRVGNHRKLLIFLQALFSSVSFKYWLSCSFLSCFFCLFVCLVACLFGWFVSFQVFSCLADPKIFLDHPCCKIHFFFNSFWKMLLCSYTCYNCSLSTSGRSFCHMLVPQSMHRQIIWKCFKRCIWRAFLQIISSILVLSYISQPCVWW